MGLIGVGDQVEGGAAVALPPPAPQPTSAAAPTRGRERSAVLARTLGLVDITAALIAASTAVLTFAPASLASAAFVAAVVMAWSAITFSLGLYGADDLRSWVSGVPEIPHGLVVALLVIWPLIGAATLLDLPREGALVAWTVTGTMLLTSVGRAGARAALHRAPALRQRTLIIGSGVVAGQIVEKLRMNDQFGLVPIGIVDDDVHDVGTPDLPRLGGFADIDRVLDEFQVDRVIIAFSRAGHQQFLECIRACRDSGVAVDVIPRLFEFLDGVPALDHVAGLPVLSIGAPRLSRLAQTTKRTLDLVVSGLALIAVAPLFALVAVAIKLESPGPVFFRQPRAGRKRCVFQLIKFRSMYSDAEQRKKTLAGSNDLSDGVMFKIRLDPRVTRVGRVLRRFSLDELPQLFNVFRGEMSLVGPRPLILPETHALAEDWHLRRLELRPGMTGPWQIYGRSQTPFHEMVRFDYQYVAGWSLSRDIEILLATVPAVLSGRGAY